MRTGFFSLFILLIFSCKESTKDTNHAATANTTEHLADSVSWVQSLREFRDAVYQNDKAAVKKFVDFPIMNLNNEIWYLVYNGDNLFETIPDTIVPFTEKDFDKYFHKLFTQRFITAVLKIKSEELYRTGENETIEFKEGPNTTYKMYGTFDRSKKKLIFHLWSDTIELDEHGERQDGGEFSIMYYFEVLDDVGIRFREVRIAG